MSKIKRMQAMCGTFATAKYLRGQGIPLELAVFILARKKS
jgi:hypothetical protein